MKYLGRIKVNILLKKEISKGNFQMIWHLLLMMVIYDNEILSLKTNLNVEKIEYDTESEGEDFRGNKRD